jgi:hypothetical protein
MNPDEIKPTKITENSRAYFFPNGEKIVIKKARELFVSDKSGNHRITTENGKFHIIQNTWLHIEIDSEVGKWER